jgi:uncharacterized membrane protein YqaE (UPF0057 family)
MSTNQESSRVNLATLVLMPPLAVYLNGKNTDGKSNTHIQLVVNLILTCMLWLPGNIRLRTGPDTLILIIFRHHARLLDLLQKI